MSIDKKAKQHLIDIRKEIIRQGQWPTCTNCAHWGEYPGITDGERMYYFCNRYQTIPPEDTVVVGCINHEPEVPF